MQQRAVYAEYHYSWQNLFRLWKLFKIAEFHEIMRQKGDSQLINLPNKVRIASFDENDEIFLRSRFVVATDINYSSEALHTFAENKPAQLHHSVMLGMDEHTLYTIPAIDEFPNNVDK